MALTLPIRARGTPWYGRSMEAVAQDDGFAGLAFLLGTWRGSGEGEYPTIEPFGYEEEISVEYIGDTFLVYTQRSWSDDGAPIHLERGFLRPGADGEVELTLAHPLGLVEVAHGRPVGDRVTFETAEGGVGRTRTGSDVTGVVRRYAVDDDTLSYEVDMATERTEMTIHLRGALRRQP
jgi:hypothetical protein